VEVTAARVGFKATMFVTEAHQQAWQMDSAFTVVVDGVEVLDRITKSPLNRIMGYATMLSPYVGCRRCTEARPASALSRTPLG
jgi:hypothetical protein